MKVIKAILAVPLIGLLIFIVKSMSSPFLAQKLISENYVLMDNKQNKGWDIRLKESNSKYKTKEELITRCNYLLYKGDITKDKEEAIKYCTKPKTLEIRAKEINNREPIDTRGNNDIWKPSLEIYKTRDQWLKNRISINKIDGSPLLINDATEDKLKIWCSHEANKYLEENKKIEDTVYYLLCTKDISKN